MIALATREITRHEQEGLVHLIELPVSRQNQGDGERPTLSTIVVTTEMNSVLPRAVSICSHPSGERRSWQPTNTFCAMPSI